MICGLCDRNPKPGKSKANWKRERHGFWVWVCPCCQLNHRRRESWPLRKLGLVTLHSKEVA